MSERLKARLQEALNRAGPTHGLDDVVDLLKAGKAQWWSNGDGCVVTEISEKPLAKVVNWWLIAGDMEACADLVPHIEKWAIGEGCTVSMATGRPGWFKIVPRFGWRLFGHTYFKPLTDSAKEFAHGGR